MKKVTGKILVGNKLEVDFDRREMRDVTSNKESVQITGNKYSLLCYLWLNKNMPMTTGQIFQNVWNDNPDVVDADSTVRNSISILRGMIADLVGDEIARKFIESRHGLGYAIRDKDVKVVSDDAKVNTPHKTIKQVFSGEMNFARGVNVTIINNVEKLEQRK